MMAQVARAGEMTTETRPEGEKGKYKHNYTIARESQKEMVGAGRRAFKNMVPLMLQREACGAWLRR